MTATSPAVNASQPISSETLARLGKRTILAIAGKKSEALGQIDDPDAYFAADKAAILAAVGDLSNVKVPLNRILIAIFVRGEKVGSIIIPDKTRDEDVYQGVAGLVVKMGPHCYEVNKEIAFTDEDRCKVGDWVMFRRGEGFRTRIWGRECVMMESERGVKMVIPRPDMVF
jgi:co-chaperonin GroES (HSP10)